MTEAILYLLD